MINNTQQSQAPAAFHESKPRQRERSLQLSLGAELPCCLLALDLPAWQWVAGRGDAGQPGAVSLGLELQM